MPVMLTQRNSDILFSSDNTSLSREPFKNYLADFSIKKVPHCVPPQRKIILTINRDYPPPSPPPLLIRKSFCPKMLPETGGGRSLVKICQEVFEELPYVVIEWWPGWYPSTLIRQNFKQLFTFRHKEIKNIKLVFHIYCSFSNNYSITLQSILYQLSRILQNFTHFAMSE